MFTKRKISLPAHMVGVPSDTAERKSSVPDELLMHSSSYREGHFGPDERTSNQLHGAIVQHSGARESRGRVTSFATGSKQHDAVYDDRSTGPAGQSAARFNNVSDLRQDTCDGAIAKKMVNTTFKQIDVQRDIGAATAEERVMFDNQEISHEEFDLRDDIQKWKGMVKSHYVDKESRLSCAGCKKKFTLKRRPFHCRRCGDVFCRKCVSYKRRLNRLARPDPAGKQRKVCLPCFEGDLQDDGCTRSLTSEFKDERKMARDARVIKQRVGSLTTTFWRDQLDIKGECLRLLDGFRTNVKQSESHKTLQEIRGALKTPDWQKAPAWELEMKSSCCRACKGTMGVRKSSGNCRVCGLALCRKCSNKELLLYYPDDCVHDANVPCEPILVIINEIGSPEKEPAVSLLRYVCSDCKAYISQEQRQSPTWYREPVAVGVMDKLDAMDTVFTLLSNDINKDLLKFQDWMDAQSGRHDPEKVLDYVHKITAKFDAYEKHFLDLKRLLVEADTFSKRCLLQNYTRGRYDFLMECRHTYRRLRNKSS